MYHIVAFALVHGGGVKPGLESTTLYHPKIILRVGRS